MSQLDATISTDELKTSLEAASGRTLNPLIQIPEFTCKLDADGRPDKPVELELRTAPNDKALAEKPANDMPAPKLGKDLDKTAEGMLVNSGNGALARSRQAAHSAAALDPKDSRLQRLANIYDKRAAEKFGIQSLSELGPKTPAERGQMQARALQAQIAAHPGLKLAGKNPKDAAAAINKKELEAQTKQLTASLKIEVPTPSFPAHRLKAEQNHDSRPENIVRGPKGTIAPKDDKNRSLQWAKTPGDPKHANDAMRSGPAWALSKPAPKPANKWENLPGYGHIPNKLTPDQTS
ncbi:MAG: hypothetical protein WDO70_07545 [Alphaproteobacteria bacterium]